ncbi:MAG: hypothetical protein KJ674_04905 [Nanoarchaeota archaeon]|nr:hypothetical protein [Nanoarchaeota archaeon]
MAYPLNITTELIKNFNTQEALTILKPALIFILAMVVYSIFIFKFYKFIARKDIFELNLKKYNTSEHPFFKKLFGLIFYIIEFIIFFPIVASFWFIALTILLSFLAREQTIQNVLLVSVALVATIRITSYYSEDLSKDLAKMLPFALLGIVLIDISYFSPSYALEIIKQLPSVWKTIYYYLIFIVSLEFILRILYGIKIFFTSDVDSLKVPIKE